jgi:hypothetical protein
LLDINTLLSHNCVLLNADYLRPNQAMSGGSINARWLSPPLAHILTKGIDVIRYKCQECQAELESSANLVGKKDQCPVCGHICDVPSSSSEHSIEIGKMTVAAVRETVSTTYQQWKNFREAFLHIDQPDSDQSKTLRHCSQCTTTTVGKPRKCTQCGGLTTGSDVAGWLSGYDGIVQHSAVKFATAETERKFVVCGVLIAIASTFLISTATRGFVAALGWTFLVALVAFPLYGTYVFFTTKGLERVRMSLMSARANKEKHLTGPYPPDRICEELVFPFLNRNQVHPFESLSIPPQEAEMLREYLVTKGLAIPRDVFKTFLHVCAMKRDVAYFGDRIQTATTDGTYAVRAYSYLFSNNQDDLFVPFLQNYLCQSGRPRSREAILADLAQCRKQNEMDGFEKDLQQRSSGSGRNISIQEIDAMDPFNFELLLGMIFETQGFRIRETPKTGDQGADVLLEKAGEATVVQAKLYSHPVSNTAVQEAVAAKAHFNCHYAMVATNNDFTKSARELATSNGVRLIGRNELVQLLNDFNRSPKDYGRLARLMVPRNDSDVQQVGIVIPPNIIEADGAQMGNDLPNHQ